MTLPDAAGRKGASCTPEQHVNRKKIVYYEGLDIITAKVNVNLVGYEQCLVTSRILQKDGTCCLEETRIKSLEVFTNGFNKTNFHKYYDINKSQ